MRGVIKAISVKEAAWTSPRGFKLALKEVSE